MSVPFESAARLSALKSKIDTALGTSSSTLSKAVDNAIERGNIQTEEQTVTPTAAGFDVTPASGKYLSKVTVNPVQASALEVTPTESDQTFTPDAGKFFSAVLVKAAEGGKKVHMGVCSGENYILSVDVGVPLGDDDVFIAFQTRENLTSNMSIVMRLSKSRSVCFYRTEGIVTFTTVINYSNTTVTVSDDVYNGGFEWYLIQ